MQRPLEFGSSASSWGFLNDFNNSVITSVVQNALQIRSFSEVLPSRTESCSSMSPSCRPADHWQRAVSSSELPRSKPVSVPATGVSRVRSRIGHGGNAGESVSGSIPVSGIEHLSKRLAALTSRSVGDKVFFTGVVKIGSREFTSAIIEHDFRTASGARLLRFQPGDVHYVFKQGNVQQEVAVMATLHNMNERWRLQGLQACGSAVQAVTYNIIPVGTEAGFMEAVVDSLTLRELIQCYSTEERQFRVLTALERDPARLDKLAATTVAYLTAGYALGIRDSHDDNMMLRQDGAFFRVDFGYIFGAKPQLDAPPMAIPRAVIVALGESRWKETLSVCEQALMALSGDLRYEPPAWACIRSVPEMALLHNDALAHARLLSLEAFREDLKHADEWSLQRAAKNRIREMVRFIVDPNDAKSTPKSHRTPQLPSNMNAMPQARSIFAQPIGDDAPAPESDDELWPDFDVSMSAQHRSPWLTFQANSANMAQHLPQSALYNRKDDDIACTVSL